MIIKGSIEYDSILNVGADIAFIENFFKANFHDLDAALKELLKIYAQEHERNSQISQTKKEKDLADILNSRDFALIERAYASFKIQQIENNGENSLSIADTLARANLKCSFAENDLKVEELCISLLRAACHTDSTVIWGKERAISAYSQDLEKRTAKPEEGTLSTIEQCKINLDFAQRQLNNILLTQNQLPEAEVIITFWDPINAAQVRWYNHQMERLDSGQWAIANYTPTWLWDQASNLWWQFNGNDYQVFIPQYYWCDEYNVTMMCHESMPDVWLMWLENN